MSTDQTSVATGHSTGRHATAEHAIAKHAALIFSLKGGVFSLRGEISLLATVLLAAVLLPAAGTSLAQTRDTRPVWIRSAGEEDASGEDESRNATGAGAAETSSKDSSKASDSPKSSASSESEASKDRSQVASFTGPAKAYVGEPVTYRALIEREGMNPTLSYQWEFGEDKSQAEPEDSGPEDGGGSGADTASSPRMISTHLSGRSKVAATHTYEKAGTYPVTFSAIEEGQKAVKRRAMVTVREEASDSSGENRAAPVASAESSQADRPTQGSTGTGDRSGTAIQPRAASRPERTGSPGQWGVVVASLRSARKADVAANQYRRQLEAESVSVKVMHTDLEENRRFRVVVGMFESDEAAQDAIATHEDKLPAQAWTVRYRFLSESDI